VEFDGAGDVSWGPTLGLGMQRRISRSDLLQPQPGPVLTVGVGAKKRQGISLAHAFSHNNLRHVDNWYNCNWGCIISICEV
jgi:hypothetical protein